MINGRARSKAGLAVLMLVLTPTVAGAHADKAHAALGNAHRADISETAKSPDAAEMKQHVYFRPFCRRARYVTSRSTPCWE